MRIASLPRFLPAAIGLLLLVAIVPSAVFVGAGLLGLIGDHAAVPILGWVVDWSPIEPFRWG